MSNETIFGEASGIYRLDGERIFHNEAAVWERTLGYTSLRDTIQQSNTEFMDFWMATPDITVKPGSFDKAPAFTLDQAVLPPRFGKMRKAQLADWIAGHKYPMGVNSEARNRHAKVLADTHTRSQLQTLAISLWQQPEILKDALK